MKKVKIPLTVDFYGAIIKNILRLWLTGVNEDRTVRTDTKRFLNAYQR